MKFYLSIFAILQYPRTRINNGISRVLNPLFRPVVRSLLVHVIIEPVRIKRIRMTPPGSHGLLCRIVIRIIVDRNIRIQSLAQVTMILGIQCQDIVLRMSCYEDILSPVSDDDAGTALLGIRYNLKTGILLDGLPIHTGIP